LVHIKVFVDLMADIGCFEKTADIGEESATDNVEQNRILLFSVHAHQYIIDQCRNEKCAVVEG
jgi:hypothetical protein